MKNHPTNRLIEPQRVNLVTGVLTNSEENLQKAKEKLSQYFGPIDCQSPSFLFDKTDYYEKEMGVNLFRVWFGFKSLINAEEIVSIKLKVNAIESFFSVDNKRTINIDPGYIDVGKLVLVSVKYGTQKIYLGSNIWADIVLMYENGKFTQLPWSFPDFKSGIYNDFLKKYRSMYKLKLNCKR